MHPDQVSKLANDLENSLGDLADSTDTPIFQLSHIADIKSNMKPLTWLIKNILEQNTMAVIFGPAGSGKSFLAIDMCCHVATGKDWHGHKVKLCQVIYIKGEGHNGFGRRIKAWERHHDHDLNEYQFYASETSAQLYSLESAVQVSEAIEGIIQDTSQPILVIIDTLARNFGPANENSTEDMNQFIDHIDQFIMAKFKATVIIVHHTGVMNKDRGRGSSALNAALDFEYKVEQLRDGIIQVENTKTKDSEPPSPLAFNMISVDTSLFDENGLPVHSVALEPTEAIKKSNFTGLGNKQKALLELLLAMHKEHKKNLLERGYPEKDALVSVRDWQERAVSEGLYRGQNTRQQFGKTKDALVNRKLITITGVYVIPNTD